MTATVARRKAGGGSTRPSLRTERTLCRDGHALVAGMDEVGRGALAGPVTVGVVVVGETTRSAPAGIRDSKLLPPSRREALVAPVRRWAAAWGVGHAQAQEIDDYGILAALHLAGCRALAATGITPDIVLLDGSYDWLTRRSALADPAEMLADADDVQASEPLQLDLGLDVLAATGRRPPPDLGPTPAVRTLVKADLTCSSVAGASILAKVARDAIMTDLSSAHPAYGWDGNKGYAAPEHRRAIREHGPSAQHRRTWRLAGQEPVGRGASAVGAMGHDGSVKVRVR